MKYFSMFSGIGGFEIGIEKAYEENCGMAHDGKKNIRISGGQETKHGARTDIPLSERPDKCAVCGPGTLRTHKGGQGFREVKSGVAPTILRRLTPLECERLMGYPDGWTEGLSDTQRYKTLGNGIVSNVVAEVIKRIYI